MPALIHSLLRSELEGVCTELGQPRFRADQLWHWLYVSRVREWPAMRNLPAALREILSERYALDAARLVEEQQESGGTRKVLVAFEDGERVEAVLIPAGERRTVCVSTQAGCRYRCAFCASGQAGFRRELQAGEIVGQVLVASDLLGERPTHVVFMGIGEPLDNYDAALRAVRILNDGDGLAIGARRITISTCGLVPGIRRLAEEGLQVELSVSLHAPDDALRSRLMPVNRRWPLSDLLAACRDYTAGTGRIVTFEYTLIRNVNDSPAQAEALAALLAPLHCRANFIALNEVAEFDGEPATQETAQRFVEALGRKGVNATIRASRGSRVRAACGQLRYAPGRPA